MKAELYQKLFARMDELGAIRKEIVKQNDGFGETAKLCAPLLSDFIIAIKVAYSHSPWSMKILAASSGWDASKPFLEDQSDELGEALYSLIK